MTSTAHLFHAYGPATDTAAHLAALGSDDEAALQAAVRHLWSAVLHQGTASTTTPVAVERILELLVRRPPLDRDLQLELLAFLEAVADEGTAPTVARDELVACADAVPDVEDQLRTLYAEGREDEFYDDPDLTGALLALAVLRCRALQPRVVAVVTALSGDAEVSAAAARVAAAARRVDSSVR